MKLSEKIQGSIWEAAGATTVASATLKHWAKDASQLEQAQTWIPVSERLPEKGVDVLCLLEGGGHAIDSYYQHVGKSIYFLGDREEWRIDVTHWMPIPPSPEVLNPT